MTINRLFRVCSFFGLFVFQSVCALELINVTNSGERTKEFANSIHNGMDINQDGRFVAFTSDSRYLVNEVTNAGAQVYLRDRDTGKTKLISKTPSGDPTVWARYHGTPSISADGQFVVYTSNARDLVENDTNGNADVFLYDRLSDTTQRINLTPDGRQSSGRVGVVPTISENGRYVMYDSAATDLVADNPGLVRGGWSLYVFDQLSGLTKLVNRMYTGEPYDGPDPNHYNYARADISDNGGVIFSSYATKLVKGFVPVISSHPWGGTVHAYLYLFDFESEVIELFADELNNGQGIRSGGVSVSANGETILFGSPESNLVPNETHSSGGVFIYHRPSGNIKLVSVSYDDEGKPQNIGFSRYRQGRSISEDGKYVIFISLLDNLVRGDTNKIDLRGFTLDQGIDVFVHDVESGQTRRVSLSSERKQGYKRIYWPVISGDGRSIVFGSNSTTLLKDDSSISGLTAHYNTFLAKNPFTIELVGQPTLDQTSESGVYLWQDTSGRTFLRSLSGANESSKKISRQAGSVIAQSIISSVLTRSFETQFQNNADSVKPVGLDRLDFETFVTKPYMDQFSFLADNDKSLCIVLNQVETGLFLGPDKVRVATPYDITAKEGCGPSILKIDGAPQVDPAHDRGWYIWRENNQWKNHFVSGKETLEIDWNDEFEINKGETLRFEGGVTAYRPYTNTPLKIGVEPVSIESNDRLDNWPDSQLNFSLNVTSPYKDGFVLSTAVGAYTCIYLNSPQFTRIYLGPEKVEMPSRFTLETLTRCQSPENKYKHLFNGRPNIDLINDDGVFLWRNEPNQWEVGMVSARNSSAYNRITVNSNKTITGYEPISIESYDSVIIEDTSIKARLGVGLSGYDGFKFTIDENSNTCYDVESIYYDYGIDLKTFQLCDPDNLIPN